MINILQNVSDISAPKTNPHDLEVCHCLGCKRNNQMLSKW